MSFIDVSIDSLSELKTVSSFSGNIVQLYSVTTMHDKQKRNETPGMMTIQRMKTIELEGIRIINPE